MSFDSDLIKLIKNFIDKSKESKIQTAHMLINFKTNIQRSNNEIQALAQSHDLSNEKKLDSVQHISKHLISYISTWCIYIKQNMISTKDIKRDLGGFLRQEDTLLRPMINLYLSNKTSEYHYDAVNCKELFKECKNKEEDKNVQ